jgi:WhiB family redox-sensing transcriptional regulator
MNAVTLLSQSSTDVAQQSDLGGKPWRRFALCVGHEPDLWFPTESDDDAKAVGICQACPVRLDCLGWALESNERYGIWGGVSARRRQRIRAEMRRADA